MTRFSARAAGHLTDADEKLHSKRNSRWPRIGFFRGAWKDHGDTLIRLLPCLAALLLIPATVYVVLRQQWLSVPGCVFV